MTNNTVQVGRLAMRVEGDWWKAYYALPDTMQGALLLGQIHMGAVTRSLDRKHEFMELMQAVVSDFIAQGTGERPSWPEAPIPAPEHERSGRG